MPLWRPSRRALLLAAPALILPSRRGSAWVRGSAGPPPAPAAAVGFNTRTFFDDFNSTSTIDYGKTFAPGFNWYFTSGWPNATPYTNVYPVFTTIAPTNIANVTVSGSLLTINNDPSGIRYAIASAGFKSSAPGYVGQAFANGFYFEHRTLFVSQTPSSGQVSAVWSQDLNYFIGATGHFGEIDFIEATPIAAADAASITGFVHDWQINGSNVAIDTSTGSSGNYLQASPPISHAQLSSLQTYGVLWVPAAKNGGTGIIKRYFNGSEVVPMEQTYSAGGLPNPASGNQPPTNGQFSVLDSSNMMIIIGCDATIPTSIDYVAIWQ